MSASTALFSSVSSEEADELYRRLADWLDELRELRSDLPEPAPEDGPHALHASLVKTRKALDRAESLLAGVIRLRGLARESVFNARATLKEAEDQALQNRTRAFPEFVSTRERLAWLAGMTESSSNAVVRAEAMLNRLDTVYDEANLLYRGIDSVRREVDVRLRILVYERNLER